ncbi:hypothetical protein SSX86_024781 [Deinandra increscens subsp. villosa]|uniref:CCHC-type domain-containing protein n=1 Tax=Deinandra increscens subsp. villosa TaxID=3103831 RepID=A0AAP0CHB5_9ASTR
MSDFSLSCPNGSSNKPPMFTPDDFGTWKLRMEGFVRILDRRIWKSFTEGPYSPMVSSADVAEVKIPKPLDKYVESDYTALEFDHKAYWTLQAALPNSILSGFKGYKIAFDLWNALSEMYEGTSEVKENKKDVLKQKYEKFTFKSGETMTNQYLRFVSLLDELQKVDVKLDQVDVNRKFLRSLPSMWTVYTVSIRECKNLKKMRLSELHGILSAYEMELDLKQNSSSESTQLFSSALVTTDFNSQSNYQGFIPEDLECIGADDLEEMDIMTQLAMVSVRAQRFYKRTGRTYKGAKGAHIGLDKSKLDDLLSKLEKSRNETKDAKAEVDVLEIKLKDALFICDKFQAANKKAEKLWMGGMYGKAGVGYNCVEPPIEYSPSSSENTVESKKTEVTVASSSASVDQSNILKPSIAVPPPTVYEPKDSKVGGKQPEQPKGSQTQRLGQLNFNQVTKLESPRKFEPKVVECMCCGEQGHLAAVCQFNPMSKVKPFLIPKLVLKPKADFQKKITGRISPVKNHTLKYFGSDSNRVLIEPRPLRFGPPIEINQLRYVQVQKKGQNSLWVVDSGCTCHVTGNKHILENTKRINGGPVAFGITKGHITTQGDVTNGLVKFDRVNFVDTLNFNLLSVSQMCDKNLNLMFNEKEAIVLKPGVKILDELIMLMAPSRDGLYILDMSVATPSCGTACFVSKASVDESDLWHRKLGHVNYKNMNRIVNLGLVKGLPNKHFACSENCVPCLKGKQHRTSFKPKVESSISKPLELLHMDLFGPTRKINQISRSKQSDVTMAQNSKIMF